jgi:hypothetical protein
MMTLGINLQILLAPNRELRKVLPKRYSEAGGLGVYTNWRIAVTSHIQQEHL